VTVISLDDALGAPGRVLDARSGQLPAAQGGSGGWSPNEALRLMREAALTAATALLLGDRTSTFAWTLHAPFDPYVRRHSLGA
jgi:hypothetical protein